MKAFRSLPKFRAGEPFAPWLLASDPQVLAEVAAANQQLARVQQVKRWHLLPVEWTAETEELTPTLNSGAVSCSHGRLLARGRSPVMASPGDRS